MLSLHQAISHVKVCSSVGLFALEFCLIKEPVGIPLQIYQIGVILHKRVIKSFPPTFFWGKQF